MEGYLEFSVGSFLNVKHGSDSSKGENIGFIYSVILVLTVFLFPTWMVFFIIKNIQEIKIHAKLKNNRYSALYDGLNKDSMI